jgi:hypothetical protein
MPGAAGFEELGRLLDGASEIYCHSFSLLYGLLRATAGDVENLDDYAWAPASDIDDPALALLNPLRPAPGDPYLHRMSPHAPYPVPTPKQAEGCTRPTRPPSPDSDWVPRSSRKPAPDSSPQIPPAPADIKNVHKSGESHGSMGARIAADAAEVLIVPGASATVEEGGSSAMFSEGSGAAQYNSGDTPDMVRAFLASERWLGAPGIDKPANIYFRDSRMIHWMFRTTSLTEDLKTEEFTLDALDSWNRHLTWWNAPAISTARNAMKRPTANTIPRVGKVPAAIIQGGKSKPTIGQFPTNSSASASKPVSAQFNGKPASAQFNGKPAPASGQFGGNPVSGQSGGNPASRQIGGKPASGQFRSNSSANAGKQGDLSQSRVDPFSGEFGSAQSLGRAKTGAAKSSDAKKDGTKGGVGANGRVLGALDYRPLVSAGRWDEVRAALELEVRTVADLSTLLLYHQLPLIMLRKSFNRKFRAYEQTWKLISLRVSTPAILEYTACETHDPTTEEGRAAHLRPNSRSRLTKRPLPFEPLSAQERDEAKRNPDVYSVVCAVAPANARHASEYGYEGLSCDMMYYQSQNIAAVACLVISAQHPLGICRFFAPHPPIPPISPAASHS